MALAIGDTVEVTASWAGVTAGRVGRVVAFSKTGQKPVVDISNKGRFLIPEDKLTVRDAPLPASTGDTPRLSADLPPPAVLPEPARPVVDWCERPAHPTPRAPAANGKDPAPTKPRRTCTVDGCGQPHLAKGLCGKHYWRMKAEEKRKKLENADSQALETTEKNALQLAESDSAERERNSAQDEIPVSGNQNMALQPMAHQEPENAKVLGIADPRDYAHSPRELTIPATPYAIIPASADVHGHLNDAVTSLRQALAAASGDASILRLQQLVTIIGTVERSVKELPE